MTSSSLDPPEDPGAGTPGAPGPSFVSGPGSAGEKRGASSLWSIAGGLLDLSEPVVMGILNLTPDSFSDGGSYPTLGEALDRAAALVEEGAGILDVGGESTRPGADPVPVEEEMKRVLPFVREATASGLGPLSIDTRRSDVAREALREGARIVNDVSGLTHDPAMARVVADEEAGLVLSHMRGTPSTMVSRAVYQDVVAEVVEELGGSLKSALAGGVARERIVVDPGIGFAKTAAQSLTLLRRLTSLRSLGCPILVGPSRKSFIGALTGLPPSKRAPGTIAACVIAYLHGARIFRVHDVAQVTQALGVARAILGGE